MIILLKLRKNKENATTKYTNLLKYISILHITDIKTSQITQLVNQ